VLRSARSYTPRIEASIVAPSNQPMEPTARVYVSFLCQRRRRLIFCSFVRPKM
jgi:hypothetical protein